MSAGTGKCRCYGRGICDDFLAAAVHVIVILYNQSILIRGFSHFDGFWYRYTDLAIPTFSEVECRPPANADSKVLNP